ncbi:hypothetical protein BJ508DRAFT_54257 [Ascobolus immersus RN42]|uniref:F-box domain-containing protein n=1 Tax=Ascobolus immersus RN42 TaxID=1160509 RepID=A0A3N4HU32_ASCIM|nr:hypothetical protein BJ508DRAFT_54257 [Ascobolus immersus RN42]
MATTSSNPHLQLLDLPFEILLTIVKFSNSLQDIDNLCLTHRTFNSLVASNQSSIFGNLAKRTFRPEAIDLLNCLRPNALSPYQQERMVLCLNDVALSLREPKERVKDEEDVFDWSVYFTGQEDSNPKRLHPDPRVIRSREYMALQEQYELLVQPYRTRFQKATGSDDDLENFFYWVHGFEVPARLPRAPASETELDRMEKAFYNLARMLKHFHTVLTEVDEENGEYKLEHGEIVIAKRDGRLVIDDMLEVPYAHTDVVVLDVKGVMEELSLEDHMNIASVVYFFTQKKVAWALQGGYYYLLNEMLGDRLVCFERLGLEDREDVYIDVCEARDFSIWDQFQTNVELWSDRSRDPNFGYPNGFNLARYMVLNGKAWTLARDGKPEGVEKEMWIPDHPSLHGSKDYLWDPEADLLELSDDESDEGEDNDGIELLEDLDGPEMADQGQEQDDDAPNGEPAEESD